LFGTPDAASTTAGSSAQVTTSSIVGLPDANVWHGADLYVGERDPTKPTAITAPATSTSYAPIGAEIQV